LNQTSLSLACLSACLSEIKDETKRVVLKVE